MMNLLHRSAKRLLPTHSVCFPGLVEIPLHAFLHRYLLQEEPVQKNIIEHCARSFSVVAEDHMHETRLRDQQQQATDVYWDLPLSQQQHIHTGVTEERKCQRHCLAGSTLQPAGGPTVLKSVIHGGDCAHTLADDFVSTCISASQKGDEKRSNVVACEAKLALQVNHQEKNCCNEGISECMVGDTGTSSHKNNKKSNQIDNITSELAESDYLSKQKEESKHFVCSASDLAIFDLCKASCKDTNKEKDLDNSIQVDAFETILTTKVPNKSKQVHIVDGIASDFFACDIKSMSQDHNANFIRKKMCKVSLDSTESEVQREDIRMPRVKNSSEVCKNDAKTSSNNKPVEAACSDFLGSLNGVGDPEKVDPFGKEQVQVFQPHKRVDFAMSKAKKNRIKKRKKKNTNRRFGPEDLKHLSLTVHPSRIAFYGQGLWEEKRKTHGACLLEVQSKSIPEVAWQEPSEFLYPNNPTSREALKLKEKEKGGSGGAFFADKREVNQDIRNIFVEDKQKLFICENSSKSRLHQDQTLGEVSQHMGSREQSKEGDGEVPKNPSSTVKSHTYKENEAGDYFLRTKGKMIDDKQLKEGTFLDPPSIFWERGKTLAPEQTIEIAVERAKWDFAGVRKVHHPLTNHGELYIILDLNGVLIKRWDKNPSVPGVYKLNKKWIQLRPGCIEFLHKAFSSFRVGIWSTMTQRNVLNTCNFLEQQARESLPFFMLWSKDSCYQHGDVRRPNKSKVVADFKPLCRVWGYFKPYLGFHNTILVDDSPYKACMNNPYNCIFPDAFEGQEGDTYLNDVLWPYLENMRRSHNIQAFIADNPLGQLPVVIGHELYYHVRQVMDVFDYRASPLRAA